MPNLTTPTAEDMAAVLEWLIDENEPRTVDGIQDAMGWSWQYTNAVVTKLNLGGKLQRHTQRDRGRKATAWTFRLPNTPKVAS